MDCSGETDRLRSARQSWLRLLSVRFGKEVQQHNCCRAGSLNLARRALT
jgi:hypothetical protein